MKAIRYIFNTTGNILGSFVSAIGNLFRSSPRPDEQVTGNITDTESISVAGLDEDDAYEQYTANIEGLDDVIVTLGLHKRVSASHKYMYEMGRRDGALGIRPGNMINIAIAAAQEMSRHIYVILKGKVAALKAELITRENIMKYEEQLQRRDQVYYDYTQYQYRFFPRSHSMLLFFLYLFFSVALIIADIPLAVTLIQQGFDLPMSPNAEENFAWLFRGDFWKIIATNWETMATALGISFCTIYIKIYYDEFIGTPYASKLMTFRRFLEENAIEDIDITEREVKQEHKIKFIWKTVLFALTILIILLLAFFRLETASAETKMTPFRAAAFIAITVLFPLIGGICLSHALTNIQNLGRLRKARMNCIRSRIHLMQAVEAFTIIKKRCTDLDAADDRLGNEERMVKEYSDYLSAFYERGYAIGSMQPEKYTRGEDFYTKVLEWRNNAVSRKINYHIGKFN